VIAHQVPEDRPVADRHHWLGNGLREVPQPHSEAATEQDDLHCADPFRSATFRRYQSTDSSRIGLRIRRIPTLRALAPVRYRGATPFARISSPYLEEEHGRSRPRPAAEPTGAIFEMGSSPTVPPRNRVPAPLRTIAYSTTMRSPSRRMNPDGRD